MPNMRRGNIFNTVGINKLIWVINGHYWRWWVMCVRKLELSYRWDGLFICTCDFCIFVFIFPFWLRLFAYCFVCFIKTVFFFFFCVCGHFLYRSDWTFLSHRWAKIEDMNEKKKKARRKKTWNSPIQRTNIYRSSAKWKSAFK